MYSLRIWPHPVRDPIQLSSLGGGIAEGVHCPGRMGIYVYIYILGASWLFANRNIENYAGLLCLHYYYYYLCGHIFQPI